MKSIQKKHGILCGVTHCEYHQEGGCNMDNIVVQPCTDCVTEKKQDQSMCSSYKPCS